MAKCEQCVAAKILCDKCRDNPKYRDYPTRTYFQAYKPTCPKGYTDCICDPAYIKFNYPDWYEELYGNMSPEEASATRCNRDDVNCYDDEDK